jgi:hypothetical protein
MASIVESENNKKTESATKKPAAPPDERLWKRYSPHHEFEISSSSSIVLHVLAFAVLLVGGFILKGLLGDRPVQVAPLVIAGGGGSPTGIGDKKTGTGRDEDLGAPPAPDLSKPPDAPKESIEKVVKPTTPVLPPPDPTANRIIEDESLKSITKAAQEKANQATTVAKANTAPAPSNAPPSDRVGEGHASKGRGGTGEGGGLGKGKGLGEGDLEGKGKMSVTQREKRKLRWNLAFQTDSSGEYLKQLTDLNAMIAWDGPNGKLIVIEDLRKRPFVTVQKNMEDIDKIYWEDTGLSGNGKRSGGVEDLARGLGLKEVPHRFFAFFPFEFEKKLLEKELAYRNVPEDDIQETWFKLIRVPYKGKNTYVPEVERQTRLR